jgi:hypothetical protein
MNFDNVIEEIVETEGLALLNIHRWRYQIDCKNEGLP